jgi:EmrB/QacA subfamily drug resistance transporter
MQLIHHPRRYRAERGGCSRGPRYAGPMTATTPSLARRAAPHVYEHRAWIMAGIMLTTALAAIEGTIVATALPSVVRDFGSFASFPWVFSLYLLAQAVSVPFYGRLADMIGRRPVLLAGVSLFIVGSALCGVAWSMGSLIAFRGIQGLGAGVVFPVTQTIMGDMFDLEARAKAQGATASVWATCSVLGPALGGIFSEQASWRWIFLINIPVGLFAIALIARFLTDPPEAREKRVFDLQGGLSLLIGSAALMVALLQGGVRWSWSSQPSIALFATSILAFAWCWRAERAATDPIIPPWVISRRPILAANVVSLVVGAIVLGLTAFFPTYAQHVLGVGPTLAGFGFAAALLGWPLAVTQAGRVYLRVGFRPVAMVGGVFAMVGGIWLSLMGEHASLGLAAGGNFIVGMGLGWMATTSMISVQGMVGWSERGAATGSNMFARTLGSALGTAVFGALFNNSIAHRLHAAPAALRDALPSSVRSISSTSIQDPRAQAYLSEAIASGAHRVFVGVAILGGIGLFASTKMLRRPHER